MPLLNITSEAGASTTTTAANTALTAGAAVQFMLVNYSPKPAKVFFSGSTGVTFQIKWLSAPPMPTSTRLLVVSW